MLSPCFLEIIIQILHIKEFYSYKNIGKHNYASMGKQFFIFSLSFLTNFTECQRALPGQIIEYRHCLGEGFLYNLYDDVRLPNLLKGNVTGISRTIDNVYSNAYIFGPRSAIVVPEGIT